MDSALIEERIERLEEMCERLAFCAQMRSDEPYEAALIRHGIFSEKRSLMDLTLNAILGRAEGEPMSESAPRSELFSAEAAEILKRAYVDDPIDRAGALALLALVSGGDSSARELLQAHRDRGLGAKGHALLR